MIRNHTVAVGILPDAELCKALISAVKRAVLDAVKDLGQCLQVAVLFAGPFGKGDLFGLGDLTVTVQVDDQQAVVSTGPRRALLVVVAVRVKS